MQIIAERALAVQRTAFVHGMAEGELNGTRRAAVGTTL